VVATQPVAVGIVGVFGPRRAVKRHNLQPPRRVAECGGSTGEAPCILRFRADSFCLARLRAAR
jgi:hypothetical protein